jgi:transcriptional regulator with XRE-family HTH domain
LTPADFLRIRTLYGETQEAFGRRLGWEGSRSTVERRVHRYEDGETPIVGTLAVLLKLLEERGVKPDTRRRR